MTMTVTIPKRLAVKLAEMAVRQGTDPERLAVELLEDDLDEAVFPSVEEVVAKIRALPPSEVIPASGSLLEHLASITVEDPAFDASEWNRQWALIEAEMKSIELTDQMREGRL